MNLLPIIRRKRRSLIPPDELPVVVQQPATEANQKPEKKIPDDLITKKTSTAADVVDY